MKFAAGYSSYRAAVEGCVLSEETGEEITDVHSKYTITVEIPEEQRHLELEELKAYSQVQKIKKQLEKMFKQNQIYIEATYTHIM